jgi:hypothetical protein
MIPMDGLSREAPSPQRFDTNPDDGKPRFPAPAGLAVAVGGVLQGIGANIQRFTNSETAWGGAGVLIGLIAMVWFARRLGKWLILAIPAAVVAMIPVALTTEAMTAGVVKNAVERTGECRDWSEMDERLAPVTDAIQAFSVEFNGTASPGKADFQRWAEENGNIRRHYETLDHPPVLKEYVKLAIQAFDTYEQGFGLMANGDEIAGRERLTEGDELLASAQAEFREANLRCGLGLGR